MRYSATVLYDDAMPPAGPRVGARLRRIATLRVEGATPEEAADAVFRAMNRVDGSAVERVPDGERSMCVGDVVVLDSYGLGCVPVGWVRVGLDNDAVACVETTTERAHRGQLRVFERVQKVLWEFADGDAWEPNTARMADAMIEFKVAVEEYRRVK